MYVRNSRDFRIGHYFLVVLIALSFSIQHSETYASSCEDYTATPPFLTSNIKPNVLFMLDNSGSMKNSMYDGGSYNKDCSGEFGSDFSSTTTYYGYFDSSQNYTYNRAIPVSTTAFAGGTAPYDLREDPDNANNNLLIDTDAKGAFIVDTSCTPSNGTNCWNGNFLNWLTTRRIDAARNVLIGGKTEFRTGFDYKEDGSTTWKIVGNNEPSDKSICKADSTGQTYTPHPNDTKYHIHSPANSGNTSTAYDPYAKITPLISYFIRDKNNTIIGEVVTLKVKDDEQNVPFKRSYNDPIVVATIPAANNDPTTVRINVDSTSNHFTIRLQDWEHYDSDHPKTNISVIIMESGTWSFTGEHGDIKIIAGKVNVNSNVDDDDDSWGQDVPFDRLPTKPVILTSITSSNNLTPVTTRIKDVQRNGFKVGLQREENSSSDHPEETIHYLAMEPGITGQSIKPSTDQSKIVLMAGNAISFSSTWKGLNFNNNLYPNGFLASMQTTNDTDPATLRYRNFTESSIEIKVQEEKSKQNETTHNDEDIGYLAIYVPEPPDYNIAIIVNEEPSGLVHNIDEKVRTGISFYRYHHTEYDASDSNSDNKLYDGEWAHGGTLHLPIPNNPFVKSPSDVRSYRYIETPVKSTTETIVDAIEHYPNVWGTTPLAENLYEVGRYFSQITPYYDNKPSIPTKEAGVTGNDTAYKINNTWDPYIYTVGDQEQLIRCAKSFVIILTDGEPYRDDYVPSEIVGTTGTNNDDYDGDNESGDCSKTGNEDNSCKDNLDDVAKYLYSGTSANTRQDLRKAYTDTSTGNLIDELPGDQYLATYTVAFGSSSIPPILQDTATNGGGQAYSASDGASLQQVLTEAITDILSRTSAGTAISVLSERASNGSLINQALFFPKKTFTDTNPSKSFEVAWTGQVNSYWFYTSRQVSNIRENTPPDSGGYYALDIYHDKVLDFRIDTQGDLKVDYYDTQTTGTYLGAANTTSGTGGTYNTIDDVPKIFEVGEILKDRVVEAAPDAANTVATRRYIYANTGSEMKEFVDGNSTQFQNLFNFTNTDPIPACLGTSTNTAQAAKNLISYIRGASDDFTTDANIDIPCRNRIIDNSGKIWKLGDIIYSTPKVVNYTTTPSNNQYSMLFTGANDGMLHAFKIGKLRKDQAGTNQAIALCDSDFADTCTNTDIGKEAWTFIPKNALPYLKYIAAPEYKHIYTVDLPPYIIETEDKKILIGGMRFGGATGCTVGNNWCDDENQITPPDATPATISASTTGLSSYFALDITNPTTPTLLWEFTDPDMGFSYSGPAVITRKVDDAVKRYIMFLSGPLNSKGEVATGQDLKIYILKLNDNFEIAANGVFKIDGQGEPGFEKESKLSDLRAAFGGRLFTNGIDTDEDGSTDAIFFGVNRLVSSEYKGNVFAIAPTDDDPITTKGNRNEIEWNIAQIFNSGSAPVTAKIEYGNCYGNNYIYFGTGRWFYKLDTPGNSNGQESNSLWGVEIDQCIEDLVNERNNPRCGINGAHNTHLADDLCRNGAVSTSDDVSWQMGDLSTNTGGDYFMERNITDPTFGSNMVFFTTMRPSSDICDFGGQTRVWGFNCRTGHSITYDCSGELPERPKGALLLQLSGGNIEDLQLASFNSAPPEYMTGIPPESGTPLIQGTNSGKLNAEILLWIER